jgi:selenocysteine-specific elongation factor
MKKIVIGTAGHIDHGKTALIKALTGIDCDSLKEEKERGITTELGFAHYRIGDDLIVGIVDVPAMRGLFDIWWQAHGYRHGPFRYFCR